MQNKNLAFFLLSFTFFLLSACAKQGFPEGGPIDRTPPVVLSTVPANGSNNFSATEFSIRMDEYVNLKDANNNILISPPMREKPNYVIRGHNIIVRINDTLLPNTTYLFQFKGAIADYNEGNPLPTYEYVFSTGEHIDSMSLSGRVIDAFNLKPSKETVSVLAYPDTVDDSAVVNQHPLYFTRCDTGGYFTFNHMRQGNYRVVALVDADRNMKYDPTETLAFADTALTPIHMPQKDSTDTTHSKPPVQAGLFLLSALKKEVQRVDKSQFVSPGHFQITTKQPLTPSYRLRHLTSDSLNVQPRLYSFLNPKGDTLDCWLSVGTADSVVVILNDTNINDTLRIQYRKSSSKSSPSKHPHEHLKLNAPSATHPYFDTLCIAFSNPVATYDTTLPIIVTTVTYNADTGSDSIRMSAICRLLDTVPTRTAHLLFPGAAGAKYTVFLPAGLFTDIYGNSSDTLSFITQYTKPESYGTLSLNISFDTVFLHQGGQILVQLTNEKGDMLKQQTLTSPGSVSFAHLKAGKYSFRFIIDSNADGIWTPGNYWLHIQPEQVHYFEKTLDLRENWEINESVRLSINK